MLMKIQKDRLWKILNNSNNGVSNSFYDRIWEKNIQQMFPEDYQEIQDEIASQFEGDGDIIDPKIV